MNEASLSASSTKNAKDKSNSTAMQAVHDSEHTDHSGGRGSRCSSEKDSGFSDTGSDWQHAEDQSNRKQSRETAEKLLLNQNEQQRNGNHGNCIVAPPTQQLPSFYIIKNMVCEQPRIIQKNSHLLWSNGSRQNGVPGSNPVILLQPTNTPPPTLQLPRATLCKSNVTGKKINSAYLPILNSYPRIAPHPSKKPPVNMTLNDETQNQSKRVCTEHKGGSSQVNKSILKQPKVVLASNNLPSSSSTTVLSSQTTSSVSSSFPTPVLNKNSIINTRHRRFLNTLQVLKQSGLLDITMRTKEMLRQNNATKWDIAQLRQHSELLFQMANSSNQRPNNTAAWLNLHRVMAESGSYPDLKDLQTLQNPTTQPEASSKSESVNGGDDGTPPLNSNIPLHVVTSMTDTRHTDLVPLQLEPSRAIKPTEALSEKNTFIPPDSSTD